MSREVEDQEIYLHLIFDGRVQGVGFRDGLRRKAVHLKLRGTVRNLNDGTVEAYIEGNRTQIAALMTEIKRDYDITQVTTHEIAGSGNFKSFEIIF